MALITSNAVVTTSTGSGQALGSTPAQIGEPGPADMAQFGGRIRNVVLLPPASDVQPGDTLFIQSWGDNPVDPSRGYRVVEARPSGSGRLTARRCVIADRVER